MTGIFPWEDLIDNSLHPGKIIYNDSKIMYMIVERGLHKQVVDNLIFLSMKLAVLPQAFGLTELKKGWSPNHIHRQENPECVGNCHPPKSYGYNFMGTEERSKILEWFKSENGQRFFAFRKEMKRYCVSGVDILRQACLKFQKSF